LSVVRERREAIAVRAFVLMEVIAGKTKAVVTALQEVEGVKSVEAVTGPYDVIAVIEKSDVDAIGDLITKNFHSVSGITRTVTCLTVQLG
jgi:DNA-binding Lrp family transcriptional regulator